MNAIEEGIDRFNAHEFWHAHESWERIWLSAEEPEKRFLQGLIQLAAAYHHVQRRTYRGGVRLFDAAMKKLADFPDGFLGVDRSEVVKAAMRHRDSIDRGEAIDASHYPKLRYN